MNPQDQHTIDTAQEAVNQLVAACRKNGPLYRQRPRETAQVSRNAKWLLHAVATLNHSLDAEQSDVGQQS